MTLALGDYTSNLCKTKYDLTNASNPNYTNIYTSSSHGVQSALIIIIIACQFFSTELMQKESTLKKKTLSSR